MSKENRIGALWKPKTQSDKAPLAKGKIEFMGRTLEIVVWTNRWKKDGEKTPDFYVELDQPRDAPRDPALPEGRSAQCEQAARDRSEGVGSKPIGDEFTDDIPF